MGGTEFATRPGQPGGAPLDRLLQGLLGAEATPRAGLHRLVGQLQEQGLGDRVESWISPRENRPVAAPELAQALGEHRLQQLSQQLGLTPVALSALLARFLPMLVDELTPQGRLAAGDREVSRGEVRELGRGVLQRLGEEIARAPGRGR